MVIRDLMFHDKHYYSEFLESEESISTNILADRLKQLEVEGIICKSQEPNNLVKLRYTLTPKGIELVPIMLELMNWGMNNISSAGQPLIYIQRGLKTDRAKLIEDIKADLKEKNLS